MAGAPYATFSSSDVEVSNLQRNAKDTFDQLENLRRGALALPAKIYTKKAQLGDEPFVAYKGAADTLTLPIAANRGRGVGQAIFVMNEGSGVVTVVPSQQVNQSGKADVLTGGNVTLAVGSWATFISDGDRTWFALASTGGVVTSVKANAGGTPQSGALELDGAGTVTVSNVGGVFTITGAAAGASVTSIKANVGGTPRTGALELDGSGGTTVIDSGGGVFTINSPVVTAGVASLKANTGGTPQTGALELDGGGDAVISNAGAVFTATVARDGSYQDYHHTPGSGPLAAIIHAMVAGAVTAGSPATSTRLASTAIAVPFVAPRRGGTVGQMECEVTTASGQLVSLAIYDNTSDAVLFPKNLLFGGGSVSTTPTGRKAFLPSVALTPGALYWACFNVNSATPAFRSLTAGMCATILGAPLGVASPDFNIGISHALTFGSWPATFPTSSPAYVLTNTAGLIPMIWMRVN